MSLKKRDDYNQISQMEKRDKKTWKKNYEKSQSDCPLASTVWIENSK